MAGQSRIRVLEIAAPATGTAGRLLADAGAWVVKLEAPGGGPSPDDPQRRFEDTDKLGLTLALDTAQGRDALARLIPSFDVVVEAGPPGRLAEMGLGYERLAQLNPGLVLVSITPFGQHGPYANYRADDLVAFAMGGLMFLSGRPDLPPVVAPCRQAYMTAAVHAAGAALATHWGAKRRGKGAWLDVSMMECLAAQENSVTNYRGGEDFTRRMGSQHRTAVPGRIFACADGFIHIFILHQDPQVWQRFLDWMGRPPEISGPEFVDPRFRAQHADAVTAATERFAGRRTRRDLFSTGQALHLPITPAYSLAEVLADDHIKFLDVIETVPDRDRPYLTLRSALQPRGESRRRSGAPSPGADTTAVLRDLIAPPAPAARGPRAAELADALPLAGVRVLAFTHVAAGPYTTLQLAALGADVIKVESRTRIDSWRFRDKNRDPEESRPFADHNKNTRSVTLNLKTSKGIELAKALARRSDVVVDNFSAGVMDRLGLGHEDLSRDHPEVIVVHLSGLGSSGPYSSYVTFGPSIMAISGLTDLWNHPDLPEPVGSQTSYPDYLVGGYAAFAIAALLNERDRTGRGRELDLSQVEVALAALGPAVVSEANGEGPIRPQGNANARDVPRGCYPCAGGNDDWCVISVRSDDEWRSLAALIAEPSLADDDRFATAPARVAHRAELDDRVAAWTRRRSAHDVMEACQGVGVPAGIVATGRDLATDPHLLARGFLVDMEHPRLGVQRFPGPPVRLGLEPLPVWRLGPLMGQDNHAVFGGLLGLADAEIDQLERDGVIA